MQNFMDQFESKALKRSANYVGRWSDTTAINFIIRMNRGRAYMNRFVKRKEQEIIDSYHTCNLEDIKMLPTRIDDHYASIPINNSKAEFYR